MKKIKSQNIVDLKTEKNYREIKKSEIFSCLIPLLKNDKQSIIHYKKPDLKQ